MQTAADLGKAVSTGSSVARTTWRDMLFVSHASPEDDEFARWLALQLAKEGYPVWWRQHFGEDEGVSDATDHYVSNRLQLVEFPKSINIIILETAISENVDISKAPFPISRHGKLIDSFATFRDLLPFFESLHIGN